MADIDRHLTDGIPSSEGNAAQAGAAESGGALSPQNENSDPNKAAVGRADIPPRRGARAGFSARMGEAGYVTGRRYDAVKNAFLMYRTVGKRPKGVRSRIAGGGESFSSGRKLLAKLCLVGGYLRLFLALDPAAYNVQKFHQKDYTGVARYAKVPLMIKLSSERQVRHALELIDELMRANGFAPDPDYVPSDQANIFPKPKGKAKRGVRTVDSVQGGFAAPQTEGSALREEYAASQAEGEESAFRSESEGDPSAIDVRLPVRAGVCDRAGKRIGRIRRSVWYDGDRERLGEFRKEETNVFFYDGQKRAAYVDKNDNILTLSGGYVATIRRFPWRLAALLVLALALLTAFSVLLGLYCAGRSVGADYAPVLFVADAEGTQWSEEENLPVFFNEKFGDTKIAPGMRGSYRFVLENRNADALVFSLAFSEENEYGIGLVYRLSRDGALIAGGAEYRAADALGISDLTVEAWSSTVFELEWYWQDGEADTAAGENEAQYTLTIAFTAAVQA